MANIKKRIIFIVGPTGVGKSEIAVQLAKRINAEIISCDSMQIYKKINIISQKPSWVTRKAVKHHLLDIISPREEYNVADYQKQALLKIKDILRKRKVPLFVGGTGFYTSVLLDGIFEDGTKSNKTRERLYRQAEKYGKKKLYARLIKVDPEAASRIHPNDLRRLVRALEVYETAKIPISELQKKRKGIAEDFDVRIICLNRDRGELYKRIDLRVDRMFRQGLVAEVKRLLRLKLSRSASAAIGIKEIKGFLNGQYDLAEARRLIKRNSRHYAKRQLTWFRRDKRVKWINIKRRESVRDIAKGLWKKLC